MIKIYLDAGHGGYDSGAIGNGLREKDVVLTIIRRMTEILKNEYKNVDLNHTRNDDTFLKLSERTNRANNWGADCFVSVHCNASTSNLAKGFETFIYPNVNAETIAFQNVMHEQIMTQIKGFSGVSDRGKKSQNFHVLRESRMKAILTENLFVSNSHDASLLKQPNFIEKLARGHVLGLERFFGLERSIRPPTTPNEPNEPTEPRLSKPMFQVITGTFEIYENAVNQVSELKSKGYHDSYIKELKND